ncbi:hypothetical protein NXS19_007584 [Fusarium pseudograminearum]|nr:hypothetical protein NXS19_007584 [Fusarium pseudograminearum]
MITFRRDKTYYNSASRYDFFQSHNNLEIPSDIDVHFFFWTTSYTSLPSARILRILDVGTGTGMWAIDMADEHPSDKVIGIDISAVQPAFVPPNCIFQIDDAQLD